MSIVSLLFFLVLVGVGLYLVNTIPMDAKISRIINVVVILLVLIWLADVFGVLDMGHVGRVRVR